jgi:hypothetical protein
VIPLRESKPFLQQRISFSNHYRYGWTAESFAGCRHETGVRIDYGRGFLVGNKQLAQEAQYPSLFVCLTGLWNEGFAKSLAWFGSTPAWFFRKID